MDRERIEIGRMAVGAACAIFDDRGRILLVRHTYGRLNWELPGGMAIPGEAPDETARRELLEETGMEPTLDRLTGVYFEADHSRPTTTSVRCSISSFVVDGTET